MRQWYCTLLYLFAAVAGVCGKRARLIPRANGLVAPRPVPVSSHTTPQISRAHGVPGTFEPQQSLRRFEPPYAHQRSNARATLTATSSIHTLAAPEPDMGARAGQGVRGSPSAPSNSEAFTRMPVVARQDAAAMAPPIRLMYKVLSAGCMALVGGYLALSRLWQGAADPSSDIVGESGAKQRATTAPVPLYATPRTKMAAVPPRPPPATYSRFGGIFSGRKPSTSHCGDALWRRAVEKEEVSAEPTRNNVVQAWGVFGVCGYLSYGIAKVVPIVLEGLGSISEPWQWALLAATLLFFGYVEGYKGFQLGFSPRVVSRGWVVSQETFAAPVWHKILAPAFCIGYFHGTKKRVITSWAVTTVIFLVVVGVKQLANPYRAIIDAGVIVGLMWGVLSIVILYAQSLLTTKPPDYDPALPEDTPYVAPPGF